MSLVTRWTVSEEQKQSRRIHIRRLRHRCQQSAMLSVLFVSVSSSVCYHQLVSSAFSSAFVKYCKNYKKNERHDSRRHYFTNIDTQLFSILICLSQFPKFFSTNFLQKESQSSFFPFCAEKFPKIKRFFKKNWKNFSRRCQNENLPSRHR